MKKIILLFIVLLTTSFSSQSQVLLKDINTANGSSNPNNFFLNNGNVLFVANDQLWRTDGTSNGTTVLSSNSGSTFPYIYSFNTSTRVSLNGNMLFSAEGNLNGNYVGGELWRTDGITPNGAVLIADIYSGSNGSYPTLMGVANNKAFFHAYHPVYGNEMWSTDGNSVVMLNDINPGTGGNYYYQGDYALLPDKIIFSAYNPTIGEELYISDGTPSGTFLIKDIYPGNNSSNIYNFTVVGSKVFFTAYTPTNGTELWVTDGTEAGTYLVSDIYTSCTGCGANISNMVNLNGVLIFSALQSGVGTEIWKSDGTASGTSVLKNINSGSTSSNPQDFVRVGNKVFFNADDGIVGRELWATDGTSAGTYLVKDINISNTVGDITFPLSSINRRFINVNGVLFFVANSGAEGYELWKSDGTSSGTVLVKDFLPTGLSGSYTNFMATTDKLYFIVQEGNSGEKKLCVSDGTPAGSMTLNSLAPNVDMSNGYPIFSVGNTLYFTAHHSQYGYEIYKTDGTTAGTTFLKDIRTSNAFLSNSFTRRNTNSKGIFFSYNSTKDGVKLWKTDGSTANTNIFLNNNPYPMSNISSSTDYYAGSSGISDIITFNDNIYAFINGAVWKTDGVSTPTVFRGYHNVFSSSTTTSPMVVANNKIFFLNTDDYELWASDGTEAGTYQVKDIPNSSLDPTHLTEMNGIVYFRGYEPSTGYELWRSDGTANGTYMLKDLVTGSTSSSFSRIFMVGNKLFISIYNFTNSQYELWVSDGTSGGTSLIRVSVNNLGEFTNLNNNLLFTANESGIGRELWISDGTSGGTYLLKDINIGSSSSNPYNFNVNFSQFAVYNNKAYFSAYDGFSTKLWATDGTNAGTVLVSDVFPQSIVSAPFGLIFAGYSNFNAFGLELYRSNGTGAGTSVLADIYTGNPNSNPSNLFFHNNLLYCVATNATNGTEIFVVKFCEDNLTISSPISTNQDLHAIQYINANNIINSNSRVSYKAGKAISLNPGFKTDNVAIFNAKIEGCIHDPSAPANNPQPSSQNDSKATEKTNTYLDEISNSPSIQSLVEKSNNREIIEAWENHKRTQSEYQARTRNAEKSEKNDEFYAGNSNSSVNLKTIKEKNKVVGYELTLRNQEKIVSEKFMLSE